MNRVVLGEHTVRGGGWRESVALLVLPRYISGNLQTIKGPAGRGFACCYLGFIGNHSGVFCSGLGQTFCKAPDRCLMTPRTEPSKNGKRGATKVHI